MQANVCNRLDKLALTGGPGAGKDTFTRILKKNYPHIAIKVIRLAEPLYEVQHFIYGVCSREIAKDAQDGALLNFLGKHMRSINPQVLLERFAKNLEEVDSSVDVVLCNDARPVDLPFIKKLGFTVVHIATDPVIALERRKRRGDLSLGNSAHETELGIEEGMIDFRISNNRSFEDFEKAIISFFANFVPVPEKKLKMKIGHGHEKR